jgi:hypothetical protein
MHASLKNTSLLQLGSGQPLSMSFEDVL